jgi:hypothetical protein
MTIIPLIGAGIPDTCRHFAAGIPVKARTVSSVSCHSEAQPTSVAALSFRANMPDMPELTRRIVTSTYRYKRPPKRKAPVVLPGPVVVTAKRSRSGGKKAAAEPKDPVATAPAKAERKPAIVTVTDRKRLKLMRQEKAMAAYADPDATARIRAFFKQMIRPPGE